MLASHLTPKNAMIEQVRVPQLTNLNSQSNPFPVLLSLFYNDEFYSSVPQTPDFDPQQRVQKYTYENLE
jgi:hypothetical protein